MLEPRPLGPESTTDHHTKQGVANGPIQFKSACKIWPLLKLVTRIRIEMSACLLALAKFLQLLAPSDSH